MVSLVSPVLCSHIPKLLHGFHGLRSLSTLPTFAMPRPAPPLIAHRSLLTLVANLGSKSALYSDSENYVLIEPGRDEEFVNLEELRARLRTWLENWPGDILPADLARYSNLDEAVTYLVDSACELDVGDGSGTVQWFKVRLE